MACGSCGGNKSNTPARKFIGSPTPIRKTYSGSSKANPFGTPKVKISFSGRGR